MGKYLLKRPIKYGGETTSELVYREEMEVDDLIAAEEPKGEVAKMKGLIASMCGVSPLVIGRMSLEDFYEMSERLTPFLESGPQTGSEPASTSSTPSDGGPIRSAGSRRRSSGSGSPARRR